MRLAALTLVLIMLPLFSSLALAGELTPTLYRDERVIVIAYYKFGSRIVLAQNGSKVFSPLYLEVYARDRLPVSIEVGDRRISDIAGFEKPARFVIDVKPNEQRCIKLYAGVAKKFCFTGVARERMLEEYIQMTMREFVETITRVRVETLIATLAGLAVGAMIAWQLKNGLALLSPWNPISTTLLVSVLALGGSYWWVTMPAALGILAGFYLAPGPQVIALVKPDFSRRRLRIILLPVYHTPDGRLAAAFQDLRSIVNRLLGRHVYIAPAELPYSGWALDLIDEKGRGETYDMVLVKSVRLKRRVIEGEETG